MEHTLLLNATYEPLMIIHWQRAVTLVYLGKSDVLEEYTREIRSVSRSVRIPAVLRLRERVRTVRPAIRFSRQNVYARDRYQCQYCTQYFSPSELTFDHVVPRSQGGLTSWTNIVTACGDCNRRKANRTPEQANMKLLKRPVRPRALPSQGGAFGTKNPPKAWSFYLQGFASSARDAG